jgi:hypothetical protein
MEYVSKKGTYQISGDKFIINLNRNISNTNELYNKRNDIIDYSNDNNKIIEILEITQNSITTKYYNSWYPLLITHQNKIFYDESMCELIANRYMTLLNDIEKAKKLYSDICSEYDKFTEATGLAFNDRAANNILVNNDLSDFRIIDVGSIDINKHTVLSKNVYKHILGYYSWKHVYSKYLQQDQIDNLLINNQGN